MSRLKIGPVEVESTESILSRVQHARNQSQDKDTISLLNGIITELINEKESLLQQNLDYHEKLSANSLEEQDIQFIVQTLLPTLKSLELPEINLYIDTVEKLITKEMLVMLQVIGFDFKEAIGIPLTQLINYQITKNIASPDKELKIIESNTEFYKALQNEEARSFLQPPTM